MDMRKTLTMLSLACTAALASAAEPKVFSQQEFDKLAQQGKPVIVDVAATWCPTCKAQAPILAKLSSTPKFKDLLRFNIDFDTQKDLLRKFNVRVQSTMIAFKGKQEVGRSSGDTNPDSIERLLEKSV